MTQPIVLTTGELSILAPMTIRNDSGTSLTIRQQTSDARVFHIGRASALDVTIAGVSASTPLVITGGSVSGGNGGGILDDSPHSQLTLVDVQISGNSAIQAGPRGNPRGGIGGGISAAGNVALQGSIVEQNTADAGGGGIAVSQGLVALTGGSYVRDNQAPRGVGGGIS